MVYEVPESKKSVGQDKFEFKVGATKFSIPKMKFVSLGELEAIESDNSSALDFFGKKGTKQGDAIRGLDKEQFQALVEAWRDDSGVTAGE